MHYDVLIVGAGSAGCVLASRLSDDPNRKVLLIEAGPDYPDVNSLPEDIHNGLRPTYSHDWDYISQPGLLNRAIKLRRAKLVGGCSATNACVALRGSPQDFNDWAAFGNDGWSFEGVLPYFKKLENDLDFTNKWHGNSGPVPIRRFGGSELNPIQNAFYEVCKKMGYPVVPDHNEPGADGIGMIPLNLINGVRQSTAINYLSPVRNRSNLEIRSNVLVNKVIFSGKRAVGIKLFGNSDDVKADNIILSAGVYNSPSILMRSGIGPAAHLNSLGISVLADLPGVGQNLVDHPLLSLQFSTKPAENLNDVPVLQTILTFKSSSSLDSHDIQILPRSILPADREKIPSGAEFLFFASVVKPLSRGKLLLRSTDCREALLIDPGYYRELYDRERMIEAVKLMREISRTTPVSDYVIDEVYPGKRVSDSRDDLERIVIERTETYHHSVGTCRMGPESDTQSVVNPKGKVYGIEGLSVIDASLMPVIPAGNTNIPVIMIAEKCAENFI